MEVEHLLVPLCDWLHLTVALVADAVIDVLEVWDWKKFGSFMGPGLLMSTAFLDPGNIAANLQSGT